MAMITYRTSHGYHGKFGRNIDPITGIFEARKYLEYQGKKFIDRFDPISYIKITEQMDRHDVGHNRGGIIPALRSIKSRIMVMGIQSDILYPLHEQEELSAHIPKCDFRIIRTMNGHDGFLLEQDQVGEHLEWFLRVIENNHSRL